MQSTPELEDGDDLAEATPEEPTTDAKAKINGKIKFESEMQRTEAVAYFSALVDGLRHGQLQFRHERQHLSLSPAERVHVEVKAYKKGDKESVSFELEWRRPSQESIELDG